MSAAARELGFAADPSAVQSLLVIPGATSTAEVMPFWRAVLGYEPRPDSPDEDLVDPRGRGPGFWFEQMDEPRPGGGGAIHIAIWVPSEQAEARVAAALAAEGAWCATTSRPRGGRSPIPPETKQTSRPSPPVTEPVAGKRLRRRVAPGGRGTGHRRRRLVYSTWWMYARVARKRAVLEVPIYAREQATAAPLIGRVEEFQRLRLAWNRALAGQREVVFLSGEPGIGKTRLARSSCERRRGPTR